MPLPDSIGDGEILGRGFEMDHGEALSRFDRYPDDVVVATIDPIRYEEVDLPWTLN